MDKNKQNYTGKKRGPKPKSNKKVGFATKVSPRILAHLKGQDNQAAYIEGLVKDDIRRSSRWVTRDNATHTIDLDLFGAIPVTVRYYVYDAEPDVGIMDPGIDDWEIIEAPDGILKDELMEFINDLELKNVFSMEDAIKEA